ncbi:16325_t:CDS:2, partial [Funneliformis geosporum]
EDDSQRIKLMSTIQQLSDKEVSAASHLIETMRYPKGLNAGQLLSPYLQNKAYNSIVDSYYKHQLSNKSLKDANFKLDYSSNTVWLATSITQIGETSMRSSIEDTKLIYEFLIGESPRKWLSTSTLHT